MPVDKSLNIFYTYIHKRADDGQVFNVGKGHTKRAWETINRNRHWHNVVNKHGYVVELLKENMSESDALSYEVEMIAYGRKIGWPLVNKTDGGEGVAGYKHTVETRKKIGEKSKLAAQADKRKLQFKIWGHQLGLENVLNGKLAYARSKSPKDPFKSIRCFEHYSKAGKIGGKITGQIHIKSGHIQKIGRILGPMNGKRTAAKRWGYEVEPRLWLSKKTNKVLLDERGVN